MTYKCVVLSGGGPSFFFNVIGILETLVKQEQVVMDKVETVYACSSGSIAAAAVLLGYSWEDLKEYILDRPWDESLAPTIIKGLSSNQFAVSCEELIGVLIFKLLDGKSLNRNITLSEFYKYTCVELNIVATEIFKETKMIETWFNHKTNPNLSLVKAIAMSSAIPFIFKPIIHEDGVYVDGGLTNNYPINKPAYLKDEIIGIGWENINLDSKKPEDLVESNHLLSKLLAERIINGLNPQKSNSREYKIGCNDPVLGVWFKSLVSRDYRLSLYTKGERAALSSVREHCSKNL